MRDVCVCVFVDAQRRPSRECIKHDIIVLYWIRKYVRYDEPLSANIADINLN